MYTLLYTRTDMTTSLSVVRFSKIVSVSCFFVSVTKDRHMSMITHLGILYRLLFKIKYKRVEKSN